MKEYLYKTQPFAHQEKAFLLSRDKEAFALLMDMGTGKSKVIIDTAAWLHQHGRISGLVIIAPNGVHRNWIKNEIPAHMPEETRWQAFLWEGKDTQKAQHEFKHTLHFNDSHIAAISNKRYLCILVINIEAFSSTRGKAATQKWLKTHACLIVVDESSRIKTPSAKRTKALINLSKHADYRRILTGTPVTKTPLDLYSQFRFLDPNIVGFHSFTAYKSRYAVWRREFNWKSRREYQVCEGYQNLDELQEKISHFSFCVTKKECLDLPDKLYQQVYIELTPEQRRLYKQLEDQVYAELDEGVITAPVVLTKLLRLQQIIGGFIPETALNPENKSGKSVDICRGKNPRIEAVKEICGDAAHKVIIWARFRAEIDAIAKTLRHEFGKTSVVEYHGGVSREDRAKGIELFQLQEVRPPCPIVEEDGAVRFFVGQPRSGGIGLTLTAANTVIYYSNDFDAETRWQSEARAHRIGQRHPVTYYDLEVEGTIDTVILRSLREKKDVADIFMGEKGYAKRGVTTAI